MQWRLLVCCLLMLAGNVNAKIENNKPEIIIILDDLGYRPTDIAAFSLPTEVTFAILPQTPLASTIAERAHAEGRNVMLHMPMQASNGKRHGPHRTRVRLTRPLGFVPSPSGFEATPRTHLIAPISKQGSPTSQKLREGF